MGRVKKAKNLTEINFFISYSHVDMRYKEKFVNALKSLELGYRINTWHDGKILAGNNIDEEVRINLNKSHVIILIVTPNFLSSCYCIEQELTAATKRMENGECLIIPVIYQECTLVENLSFYRLMRVPADGKAIASRAFKNQTIGCTNATNMIKAMLNETFPKSKISIEESSNKESVLQKAEVKFPYIELVKNGVLENIEINQKFINEIPKNVENLMNFGVMMEQAVNSAVSRYKKGYRNSPKDLSQFQVNQFKLFLMDICGYVKKHITDTVGIRVHFRCVSHKEYIGIIASTDNDDSDDLATDWSTDLTPIPVYSGLIPYSEKLKKPLLKSLNSKINYKAANNGIWKEYLTHAFTNLNKGTSSILSMGISVHKNYFDLKEDLLQFLAYINFGRIVEEYIIKYLEKCHSIDKKLSIETIAENMK